MKRALFFIFFSITLSCGVYLFFDFLSIRNSCDQNTCISFFWTPRPTVRSVHPEGGALGARPILIPSKELRGDFEKRSDPVLAIRATQSLILLDTRDMSLVKSVAFPFVTANEPADYYSLGGLIYSPIKKSIIGVVTTGWDHRTSWLFQFNLHDSSLKWIKIPIGLALGTDKKSQAFLSRWGKCDSIPVMLDNDHTVALGCGVDTGVAPIGPHLYSDGTRGGIIFISLDAQAVIKGMPFVSKSPYGEDASSGEVRDLQSISYSNSHSLIGVTGFGPQETAMGNFGCSLVEYQFHKKNWHIVRWIGEPRTIPMRANECEELGTHPNRRRVNAFAYRQQMFVAFASATGSLGVFPITGALEPQNVQWLHLGGIPSATPRFWFSEKSALHLAITTTKNNQWLLHSISNIPNASHNESWVFPGTPWSPDGEITFNKNHAVWGQAIKQEEKVGAYYFVEIPSGRVAAKIPLQGMFTPSAPVFLKNSVFFIGPDLGVYEAQFQVDWAHAPRALARILLGRDP